MPWRWEVMHCRQLFSGRWHSKVTAAISNVKRSDPTGEPTGRFHSRRKEDRADDLWPRQVLAWRTSYAMARASRLDSRVIMGVATFREVPTWQLPLEADLV